MPSIKAISSLKEVLKITAKIQNPKQKLTPKHLKLAKKSWIREVQNKHYADEIKFLTIIKGLHPQSLEAKKIMKSKKLLTPSLCKDLPQPLYK